MKAILFDAANTLVWLDHPFIAQVLREHGVETTEEALLDAEHDAKPLMDELARAQGGDAKERGRAYFAAIFRQVGVPEARFDDITRRLFARHAERGLWRSVRARTGEALDELRRLGYRLGVVSNGEGRVEALLDEVGLLPRFDLVIDSGVVGLEKPDPRIFRMALERMGVEPHEAAHVGDIYEIDVLGARAAGMRAFLVDPRMRQDGADCERVAGLHELPQRLAEAR